MEGVTAHAEPGQLGDDVRAVRVAAASALVAVDPILLPAGSHQAAQQGLKEYRDVQLVNGGTQIQFTLTGQEGESYLVQFSDTLADAAWNELQTVTLDGTTTQTFTLPIAVPARYYRATEAP